LLKSFSIPISWGQGNWFVTLHMILNLVFKASNKTTDEVVIR
jgi:hypothetical protein